MKDHWKSWRHWYDMDKCHTYGHMQNKAST